MFRLAAAGQLLLALGVGGLGVLSLIYTDFALQWQPVPYGVPARSALAVLSGILLIACALGLLVRPLAATAAAILTGYLALWVLLLHGPRFLAHPALPGVWLDLSETLTLMVGGWILVCIRGGVRQGYFGRLATARGVINARELFALSLLVFGLAHFIYVDSAAGMIPVWIPARVPLAYITGALHVAAGAALLTGVLPQLAAALEALMMSAAVLLVHLPAVVGASHSREQWTSLCVATALSGSALLVASTLAPESPSRRRSDG